MRHENTPWGKTYGIAPEERDIEKDNKMLSNGLLDEGERRRAIEDIQIDRELDREMIEVWYE